MRLLAVVAAALTIVPAALAWAPVPGPVGVTVVPSMLETPAGTALVSFEAQNGSQIVVARNHGTPKVVVPNDPIGGQTQLVEEPNGAIQLYFPNAGGVARLQSTDDGQTWTGPFQTQSRDTAGVTGAAVAPDGTPYFVQWHTGAVIVFRGLNGEVSRNVYSPCCGYDVSVAVDSTGLPEVAFYSNATASGSAIYDALGPDLTPTSSTPLAPTIEHTPAIPLVADRSGTTFMAWSPGNPSATGVTVVPFRGGQPAGDGVDFKGSFAGGDPHMALAVDRQDRLWAVWSGGGAVHVARSRSHGQHFGAVVSASVPGTIYQVSAAPVSAGVGSIDVIVNTGSTLVEQTLEPGLSVHVYRTTKKVGRKRVVTRWAQALDDGIGIAGATFHIAGRTIRADAAGKAKVPRGSGKAAAAGYVGAAFRVP